MDTTGSIHSIHTVAVPPFKAQMVSVKAFYWAESKKFHCVEHTATAYENHTMVKQYSSAAWHP